MVSTKYGAQYEIYFQTQSVDFFNDILPIWMTTRQRLSFECIKLKSAVETVEDQTDSICKLVVIPLAKLRDRFLAKPDALAYLNAIAKHSYCVEQQDWTREQRDAFWKKSPYYMAHVYSNVIQPRLHTLTDLDNPAVDICAYPNLRETTRIIKQLTSITLTESEQQLIRTVVNHPTITGKIAHHGINLVAI
jgi:hypothetical protein